MGLVDMTRFSRLGVLGRQSIELLNVFEFFFQMSSILCGDTMVPIIE